MEKERKEKKIQDEEYSWNSTLTEYIVKEGIEEIGVQAFHYCENLETISFCRGIRKIGRYAFSLCGKIEEIILKEGLEEIGDCAFAHCSRLKHVVLVKGIRKVGDHAFMRTALTHFEMNEGLEKVGEEIFHGCENLKTISFPLHKIKDIHKNALVSTYAGPPLPLETLILRRPVSSPVSIPFPKVTEEDDGQLVRFYEKQRDTYMQAEMQIVDTYFFTCFALKCVRTGLYNAYGPPILSQIFRFSFRGARLPFPVRVDVLSRAFSIASEIYED
eukprot:g1666.t1